MAFRELYYQKKWFGASIPRNPKAARAILTFTDDVAAAETVTIDGTVFEFVAAAGDIADEDNIPVVVGTTLTSANAVAKLVVAVTANLDNIVASAGEDAESNNYCGLSYFKVGTEGNDITVSTTCTNASFGTDVTNLSGGQYGIPCPVVDTVVYSNPYYYWCDVAGNKDDVSWKRFTPESY